MSDLVSLEWPHDAVGLVTMTNPAINNHGSWAAIGELADALAEARETGARAVVLASGVPGHWFEHAWLTDLVATFEGRPTTGNGGSWFRCLHELNRTHVVSIAAISGDTSGGGCELGWACDLRIAEEQAWFSQPEVQIGVGTGIGGTSRLMRLIGRTATAEMVLMGRPMTAQRIHELGGVNRVVAAGTSVAVALEWARHIAAQPPAAVAGMKQMLAEAEDLNQSDGIANDQRIFGSFSGAPPALARMREIQARFDAGEDPREVYGSPLG